MASDYIESRRSLHEQEATREESNIRDEIARRRPYKRDTSIYFKVWIPFFTVAGFLVNYIAPGAWMVCPFIGVLFAWLLRSMTIHDYKKTNESLDLEQERRIQEAKDKAERLLESERNEFKNQTKAARKRFGNNLPASVGIANWLEKGFANEIVAADRRKHIKFVTASYTFQVFSNKIVANNGTFDFQIERYNPLNSFVEQVGFAQTMAIVLKQRILKKFPWDSSDKAKVPASVTWDNNDSKMTLTYSAANGNYQGNINL